MLIAIGQNFAFDRRIIDCPQVSASRESSRIRPVRVLSFAETIATTIRFLSDSAFTVNRMVLVARRILVWSFWEE